MKSRVLLVLIGIAAMSLGVGLIRAPERFRNILALWSVNNDKERLREAERVNAVVSFLIGGGFILLAVFAGR